MEMVGIWFLVACGLGFGAERFPRWVDLLGLLAGAGLVAISVSTWIGASTDAVRVVGLFAAVVYGLWAIGLGWVFWVTLDVTHGFRGLAFGRAAGSSRA